MIVAFTCGCLHEINTADPDDIGWWKEVSTDRDGFLVCVAHRQRRKNYVSLPEGKSKQVSDWKFARYSPLEMEQHLVFGKPLPERILNLEESTMPDLRDNRDPEIVGREILAAAGARGNGHAQ